MGYLYVGYPHLGNLHIGIKGLFKALEIPTIDVPSVSKETAELGVKYAPEASCFPFKTVLGNYIQALEGGADCLIALGGGGPCRFGYFGNLQEKILRDLGYDFRMMIIEPLSWQETFKNLRESFPHKSWGQLVFAARLGWSKMVAADTIERLSHTYRGRQSIPGEITRIYQDGLKKIDQISDPNCLRPLVQEVEKRMKTAVSFVAKPGLRIGLIGDIYTLLESYANYDIAFRLGEGGAEVERSIYAASWAVENFLPWERRRTRKRMFKETKGYLKDLVGGNCLESLSHAVRFARQGFDGVIQIFPMTCMPEIVTQSILPRVSEDYGIPVMSLVLDEHSSDAGLQTRLEAFMDLIGERKAKRKIV
jgi:predicted nucleotide-binding protein (sugar kinase/HSP70/actin superfamily)